MYMNELFQMDKKNNSHENTTPLPGFQLVEAQREIIGEKHFLSPHFSPIFFARRFPRCAAAKWTPGGG